MGERGVVVSDVREDLRACVPPKAGPAVFDPPAPPNNLARGFVRVGDSERGGPGFESKRIVLGIGPDSSWAIIILISLECSKSISPCVPSYPFPGVIAPIVDPFERGYGCPSRWYRVLASGKSRLRVWDSSVTDSMSVGWRVTPLREGLIE